MTERLLSLPAVRDKISLGAAIIYRYIAAGRFPMPIKSGKRSLWVESEIDAWISERIAERNMGRMAGSEIKDEKKAA